MVALVFVLLRRPISMIPDKWWDWPTFFFSFYYHFWFMGVEWTTFESWIGKVEFKDAVSGTPVYIFPLFIGLSICVIVDITAFIWFCMLNEWVWKKTIVKKPEVYIHDYQI